jgi:UDP-N-acetylglucosamine--N-acetylmuramyl-(pentapeptide) pyrophosphoryl-undecaprenol N-acetylglucosamine transferase
VYPALAIADALVESGTDKNDIYFVGSKRGLEADVVPVAGYHVELLSGRGIKRRLTIDNIGAVAGLVDAFVKCIAMVRKWKPRVVVSVGGYAAAPFVFAAIVFRVPLVLAESNAVPGAVHRLAGRFAKASAVAFPNTPLPRATVTGNPVREEIKAVDRGEPAHDAAKTELGLSADRVLVALFGGSLGSGTINQAADELIKLWRDRDDISVYHIVGKRDWAPDMAMSDDAKLEVKRVEYESHMNVVYTAADVVVCRSGATTSAEIAIVGVPAILIPLPNAPGDHQTANARALVDVGAAELLADSQCSGENLARVLDLIVSDSTRRVEMSAGAKLLGHPDAASEVADLVNRYSR